MKRKNLEMPINQAKTLFFLDEVNYISKFISFFAKGLILACMLTLTVSLSAQNRRADKDTQSWVYEIEPVSVGSQGTYLIKVWSYSKRPVVAIEQAKKNAVHGIIFKGFMGKQGVPGQRALSSNPNLEMEQEIFFKNFFAEGGKYMKFVNVTNDGAIAAEDRLKMGREYKIGVIVSVNVAGLRKDLEEAGILRGLSSGF